MLSSGVSALLYFSIEFPAGPSSALRTHRLVSSRLLDTQSGAFYSSFSPPSSSAFSLPLSLDEFTQAYPRLLIPWIGSSNALSPKHTSATISILKDLFN